jgi:hypothetical protein
VDLQISAFEIEARRGRLKGYGKLQSPFTFVLVRLLFLKPKAHNSQSHNSQPICYHGEAGSVYTHATRVLGAHEKSPANMNRRSRGIEMLLLEVNEGKSAVVMRTRQCRRKKEPTTHDSRLMYLNSQFGNAHFGTCDYCVLSLGHSTITGKLMTICPAQFWHPSSSNFCLFAVASSQAEPNCAHLGCFARLPGPDTKQSLQGLQALSSTREYDVSLMA